MVDLLDFFELVHRLSLDSPLHHWPLSAVLTVSPWK